MKKKILLFITLFTMVFMTGCGPKEEVKEELKPIDVLEKSVQSLNEIKSVEVVSTLSATVNQEGSKVDMNIPLTITVGEAKDEINMKLALGENPIIGSLETYFKLNTKDKNVDLYLPSSILNSVFGIESEDTVWLHTSTTLEDNEDLEVNDEELDETKNIDYKKVIGNNFVYVDSNEGINHYQLVINNDLIQRLATELNEEIENIEEVLKLDFYIDAKNYNITKLSMDLKELVIDNGDAEDIETVEVFDKFVFTMEFKNVNNTTVTIPDEVKNNVFDLEQYLNNIKPSVES